MPRYAGSGDGEMLPLPADLAGTAPLFVHKGAGSHRALFDTLVNDMPRAIDDQSRIRGLLFQARHFTLDPAACQFISNLAAADELLEELREFAIAPFDKMAISHNYGSEHVGYPNASSAGWPKAFQSLTLWENGAWKLFVAHEDGSAVACIPGWTQNLPDGLVQNDAAWEGREEVRERVLGSLELHRKIIDAFFLLMAQPKTYQINFNEARRSLHNGKVVKFFARSEIKIDLTDVRQLRRAFRTGVHGTPRWHEVRAHFVHFGGDRACTHEWEPVETDDGKKRWTCAGCGRKRCERRLPNGRGDANKGFVRQSYTITAGDA